MWKWGSAEQMDEKIEPPIEELFRHGGKCREEGVTTIEGERTDEDDEDRQAMTLFPGGGAGCLEMCQILLRNNLEGEVAVGIRIMLFRGGPLDSSPATLRQREEILGEAVHPGCGG